MSRSCASIVNCSNIKFVSPNLPTQFFSRITSATLIRAVPRGPVTGGGHALSGALLFGRGPAQARRDPGFFSSKCNLLLSNRTEICRPWSRDLAFRKIELWPKKLIYDRNSQKSYCYVPTLFTRNRRLVPVLGHILDEHRVVVDDLARI